MRDCRDCQECCNVYQIDSIDKKPRTTCSHLNKDGCVIYETRPIECKNYECMWIKGRGEYDDMPKLSGIMMEQRDSNLNPPTIYIATEVRKDAFKTDKGILAMDNLSKELNSRIIMINYTQDKVAGTHRAKGVL